MAPKGLEKLAQGFNLVLTLGTSDSKLWLLI
jgi:hypothetical protein